MITIRRVIPALAAALVCVVLFGGAASAAAQQPAAASVKAVLDRPRVAVGDVAQLIITVEGSEADTTPVPPAVPGLTIQYGDSSRFTSFSSSMVNGRNTTRSSATVQYRYRVEASRAGRHEIPPIAVTVGGRVTNTQPITLIAAEPQANPDYLVEIEIEPKQAYVGEPVRLRATWYITSPIQQGISFNMPGLDRLKVSDAPDSRPPGTRNDDPGYRAIRFLGGAVYPIVADVEYKGRRFTAVTLDRVITATEPGSYELGPLRIAFDVFAARQQRIVIASNPVTLEVLPLPTQGRPAGFDGLVGEYGILAAGTPSAVRAGDPIELMWKVSGSVTASTVPPMVLTSQRELAEKFRVPVEPVVPRVQGQDAVFSATVRPRPGATRIPPLALSVFDTKLKQYRVIRSEPILLSVQAGGLVSGDEPAKPTTDTPVATGATQPIREAAAAVDAGGLTSDRAVLGAALAPPAVALLVIAGILTRRRLAEDPVTQSRRAARRAVRGLRRIDVARPDAPDRAARVLREFEGRMARVAVGEGQLPLGMLDIAVRIDRLDRRRFAGRPVVIERRDVDELIGAVRTAATAATAAPVAVVGTGGTVVNGMANGVTNGARRLGVWLLVAGVLSLPIAARAAETTAALDNIRAAESIAVSDPVQAKALAATAIDELAVLVKGPQGRSAPLHLALARAYGVTGDAGRRQLALRRAARLAPWNSLAPGVEGESISLAGGEPTPLGWMGYVRAIDAPIRLWALGGAWALLWVAVVARVVAAGDRRARSGQRSEWVERANRMLAGGVVATVLGSALVGLDALQTRAQRGEAVILKPVTPRTGPDDVVFAASGAALPAGALVHLDESGKDQGEPGWVRLRVGEAQAGGAEGAEAAPVWVRAGSIERVVP